MTIKIHSVILATKTYFDALSSWVAWKRYGRDVQSMDRISKVLIGLESLGYKRQFIVDSLLPDWWTKEFASDEIGFAQTSTYLSRGLCLDISQLLCSEPKISELPLGIAKYKHAASKDPESVKGTARVAFAVARLIVSCLECPFVSPSHLGSRVREEIAGQEGIVRLSNLTDYCWQHGIPVIHMPSVPGHSIDGMALIHDGRPMIFVCKKDNSSAKLAFIIAHELGHITNGHLDDCSVIVDESVDRNDIQTQERDANHFAAEVLIGVKGAKFKSCEPMSADTFAQRARGTEARDQIDAGIAVLNYTYFHSKNMKQADQGKAWGRAANTLKKLSPSDNGPTLINMKLNSHLELEKLSDDNRDMLVRLTGLD